MLIGYGRISKADGSQSLDLQRDALSAAGVEQNKIYEDRASGSREDRPGLTACLKALRDGDVLVVWKLDRLGRSLRGGSVCLNSFGRFVKWISAAIMPPPSLVSAR